MVKGRLRYASAWQRRCVHSESFSCSTHYAANTEQLRIRFWGIFWADVSSHTSAESDFSTIGQQFGLSSPGIDGVRRYLANSDRPWLLILDNADDTNVDYQKYFPAGNPGVILLTSRNPECLQYATEFGDVHLEGLSDKDAVELLMKTARVADRQREDHRRNAEEIAVSLFHGHPLAIIQAGAYLSKGHCTLARYPKIFEKQRQRLLTYRPKQAQSRYHDVYTTFEASIDMLKALNDQHAKDALQLLSVVGMYAACQLPLSLFEQAWVGGQQILRETGKTSTDDERVDHLTQWHVDQLLPLVGDECSTPDSFRLIEAVRLLEQYSIVTVSGTSNNLSLLVHPLISAWASDRQSIREKQDSWMRAACTIALSSYGSAIWTVEGLRLRPHLRALMLMQPNIVFDSRSQLMSVRVLLHCGWLSQQLRMDLNALRFSQQILRHLHLDDQDLRRQWILLYKMHAVALRRCGQAEQAIPLLEQIVDIESSLPLAHLSRVSSQFELAYAYRSNGHFSKAKVLLESIVSALAADLKETHDVRLTAEHNLAAIYHNTGQTPEAIKSLERVLSIRTRILGQSHIRRQMTQYSLALAYLKDNQIRRAVELFEDFVKNFAIELSEDNPHRIASQTKLAWAYRTDGQIQRGQALLKSIVSGQEDSEHNSPDLIIARKIYAIMLWEERRNGESVEMMKRTVNACQQHLNPENLQRKSAEAWLEFMQSHTQVSNCNFADEVHSLGAVCNNKRHAQPDPELGCYLEGIDYQDLISFDNV